MEELLAAAAEAMDAPESMVERSAAARAQAEGVSVEDVLRAWAGGGEIAAAPPAAEPQAPPSPEEAGEPAPAADAEPAPAVEAEPAAASALLDDDAIVAAAAEKMGMPVSMVRRSAAARAKAAEMPVEAILREWAGIEEDAAPAPAPAVPAPAEPEMAAAPSPAEPAAEAPAEAQPVDVEVLGEPEEAPEPPTAVTTRESEAEAIAAGALPRWLAALFVIIPAFAIGYALFLPNGPNCGDAGSLAVDPVTGVAVNCDGSEFGAGSIDFFALGQEIYEGVGCVACHGPLGAGVASFPGFTDGQLLATFPQDSCSDQIEWISLGTAAWPDATYGANAKPVGGSGAVMPGFEGTLTAEELAAVALYERVGFGGQDLDAGLADCGLSAGDGAVAAGE